VSQIINIIVCVRYLGNKDSIVQEINSLLIDKNLISGNQVFFDAFCGTGSVSKNIVGNFDLIINDNLKFCTVFSEGRLYEQNCEFKDLGFDPFEYLNNKNKGFNGFVFNNYSPAKTERMYFTKDNASKIDFCRKEIEYWKEKNLISDKEYKYLLTCLIESVSLVSNTAGVYGAFLKHWDSRALQEFKFVRVSNENKFDRKIKVYNDKVENIIADINCDILYLDPPYTQNQYGTQYHLLETLILNDNPSVSKVTGSRPVTPLKSDWSINFKSHIAFNEVIKKTQAKHIIFSYSPDGFISKEFISQTLKRYGNKDTYEFKKIDYKKYKNFKSKSTKRHYEYLFYIQKDKNREVIYTSPMNYIGNKTKSVSEIKTHLPKNIKTFVDAFGGGFNVGININADNLIYNDINNQVCSIIKLFNDYDIYELIKKIEKIIKKFNLEKGNKESYLNLRNYFNSKDYKNKDPVVLYALILYGFNQQIRFNSKLEFNNPVGVRWFNQKILEKLISFSAELKNKKVDFKSESYETLPLDKNSFYYFDPPYMLTTGSYNDGKRGFKGWDNETELQFMKYVEFLEKKKIKFMISYVLEHNDQTNDRFKKWIKENDFRQIELSTVQSSKIKRKEILIVNY